MFLKIIFFMYYCRIRNLTVLDFFKQHVKKHPNKVCFIFEDEEWTYKQVDELSNKVAHFFLKEGYKKGDVIALLLENCPDYVCLFLGLGKIGVITALINTNLKTESLAHCINTVGVKGMIFGQNFAETLEKAMPYMQESDTSNMYCYSRNLEKKSVVSFPCKDLNLYLENVSALPLDAKVFKSNFRDKLLYIFTSGTTGLPKAAIITHRRFLLSATDVYALIGSVEPRVFYNTLPLYHSAGNSFYLGVVLVFGGKMIIRKKFSASSFWKDIVKHNVTIAAYIGEMCRYLLNQPKVPEESHYLLEVMIGNGMKPAVWDELQERFRIKNIIEVYGATEGNINIANFYGVIGSFGIVSRIFNGVQGVYPIKVQPETCEIMRGSNGLCIRCKPGEPGVLVAKVTKIFPTSEFDGYINKTESNKKIIRNCFKKGDMAFNSGDIVVMDEDGFLYFKDRSGDTFRWKGENVSSTEVENIISKILNFTTCIVYGVEIPGNEGRIGMAAVQVTHKDEVNFDKFYEDIRDRLPTYAIPAFLRLSNHMDQTGTYKLTKMGFQEQGYNPETVDDPLYVLDVKKKTYVPLTSKIYDDIIKGLIRF